MDLWIIDRDTLQTIDFVIASEATYGVDYISSDKSSFTLLNPNMDDYPEGDFVWGKSPKNSDKPGFFGVIDSYEDNKLVCNDIMVLLNFEFPATTMRGTSFEKHMKTLITRYLINDPTKKMSNLVITTLTDTAHIYQPSESPTPTNLMSYLINGFKKYNVVWKFDKILDGKIYTTLEAVKNTTQFEDTLSDFQDWEVSTTTVGKDVENELIIINPTMTNSESPSIKSTWYLTTENIVTSKSSDELIFRPTRTKVRIYNADNDKDMTDEQIANAELAGNYYSHEISVNGRLSSKIIDMSAMRIGTLANIYYKGKLFKSVLSGYEYTEGDQFIALKFGNIRSRLSEILE